MGRKATLIGKTRPSEGGPSSPVWLTEKERKKLDAIIAKEELYGPDAITDEERNFMKKHEDTKTDAESP